MTKSSTFLAGDGEGYEAQMGRWSRRLAPLLVDFAGVRAVNRVLDVGSGTGSLTFELARDPRLESIEGIDFSPIYVEHARRHARDNRVTFRVGDACELPYADGSFDCAFSSLVLQFVPNPDRAIREMRRVTRSGGIVAAATWDTRGGMVINRMFFDTAAVLDPEANRRRARAYSRPMASSSGLVKAWRDAGLRDVVSSALTIRMDFASFSDYWTSIDGKDGPYADYLSTLSVESKLQLRGLIEQAYVDGEPDGPRSYVATAWAIKGTAP